MKWRANLASRGCRTIRAEAFWYVRSCRKKYDIIFADPPYALIELQSIPDLVFGCPILEKEGRLILEHPKRK